MEGSFRVILAGQQKHSYHSPPEGHQTPRAAPCSHSRVTADSSLHHVGGWWWGVLTEQEPALVLSHQHTGRSQERLQGLLLAPVQWPPSCGHIGTLSAFLCTLLRPLPRLPCCTAFEIALLCD